MSSSSRLHFSVTTIKFSFVHIYNVVLLATGWFQKILSLCITHWILPWMYHLKLYLPLNTAYYITKSTPTQLMISNTNVFFTVLIVFFCCCASHQFGKRVEPWCDPPLSIVEQHAKVHLDLFARSRCDLFVFLIRAFESVICYLSVVGRIMQQDAIVFPWALQRRCLSEALFLLRALLVDLLVTDN